MKKISQHIVLILLMFVGLHSFAQNGEKELVSFGGHVFTEFFPIEIGKAILYDSDKIPIDTAIIDTLGYYFFYKKSQGEYFINAQLSPEDPNFGPFFPTFYPNVLLFEDAESIEIYSDNWELDISLHYFLEPSFGPGNIKGSIFIEGNKLEISGIDVQIHNESGVPIRHDQTDQYGNFEISDLSYGNYILYPQVLGFTTIPYHFEISELSTSHEDIQMTIKNGQISSYINEAIVDNNSFMCFPNPADHSLNIAFEFDGAHQIQTRVLDITGRIILEEVDYSINTYNNLFNTSDWKNGYYFIEVFINGSKAISQKVAVVH